ncbi:MAG: hypothetical protein JNK15_08510 [Planctomycetes bacterium]|nr:hypothetical protein [Planctomycetota bacterium]
MMRMPADRGAVWEDFQQRRPGQWRAHWNHATGTPGAVFGTGLSIADWRGNTIEEARRHALQVLQDEAALLGTANVDLRESIGARMGRTWSFVFDQYHRGLRVVGGRADVRVAMNGRIAMFGSTVFAIPAGFVVTPTLTAEAATLRAWQALGEAPSTDAQPAVAAPRLVVFGDHEAAVRTEARLAWEVAVSNLRAGGVGTMGRWFVDAHTGFVLRFVSDKHECGPGCGHEPAEVARTSAPPTPTPTPAPTTITFRGWSRNGIDAASSLQLVDMVGLEVAVPGHGIQVTDNLGRITVDLAAPVQITVGPLDGRHHGPIAGASAPTQTVTVSPGAPQLVTLLSSSATPAQAAHTTTATWIDRIHVWASQTLGNSPQLAAASAIGVTVNHADTCNAFYSSNNSMTFYAAGGACANMAFPSVVMHEWGHGLDDRYGGISQTNGLSEAWGDILSMYRLGNQVIGSGYAGAGTYVRTGLNTRQFPSGSNVHEQGETFMGFAWKLRTQLQTTLGSGPAGAALANEIVFGSIVANSLNQTSAVLEVFLADDDDGNLHNGTPHSADITWACNQHSLPVPQPNTPMNDDCIGAVTVVQGVNGPFSNVAATQSTPFPSCVATSADVWFKCTATLPGPLTVSTCGQTTMDTMLEIFSGTCGTQTLTLLGCNDTSACGAQASLTVNVAPGTYYIRVGGAGAATGTFSLDMDIPNIIGATTQSHGSGCYDASTAFYESFASGPDLVGQAMRLRNRGTHYDVEQGGAWIAPSGNTFLTSHGDDSVLNFVLSVPMPYPGGSVQALEVCSNGFVSAGTGNGAPFAPTAAGWLTGARQRWGTWHDFDPTAPGSGKIQYDFHGPIAVVTWNNVFSYGTSSPNRWQIQFDQYSGDVTMVWQTWTSPAGATLVGASAAGTNRDLGSRDISATLAGGFRTFPWNGAPLAATSTLPTLGSTWTITATEFPSTSPVGLLTVGIQGYWNGLDLGVIGMPGCYQWSEILVAHTLVPVAGQASWSMPIPSPANFAGFQLKAQAAALVPGANAAGLITSNGVWAQVGI